MAIAAQLSDVVDSDSSVNTAMGTSALLSNTRGLGYTASGAHALYTNISSGDNTATGLATLYLRSTGNDNVASGWEFQTPVRFKAARHLVTSRLKYSVLL